MKEDQLLKRAQPDYRPLHASPTRRPARIEQPAGRDWRHFHQVTLRWIGAIAILGMLALLVVFYLIRGMVRLESGRSGRMLVRFSAFERFVHWMTATCFIILAISGLNITFGKPLLLPLIGPEAFTDWSQWAKYAHNYLSFPFTLGVVLIFLMWIAWNIPNRVDVEWLKEGGGIVGHKHPPADRFNAGQKMIYWIVVLGGGAVAVTRLSADVPVLRHQHRRHAVRADRPRRRRRCCSSPPCSPTSISAPSAWRAPSRRCGTAPSTSTGRRSTTASGSRRKRPRARGRAAAGRPHAAGGVASARHSDITDARRSPAGRSHLRRASAASLQRDLL